MNPITEPSPDQALLALLDQHALPYRMAEHEAVFTVAEALAAAPDIDGFQTKNVFLRDGKGSRHFLAIVPHDTRLDLAGLAPVLGVPKLGMASPDRLLRYLGITPGAVSVFALINDTEQAVELLLDERVWQADKIQAHPLRNTATVSLPHDSLVGFLAVTGHTPKVLPLGQPQS